jgi:hypothetical protein
MKTLSMMVCFIAACSAVQAATVAVRTTVLDNPYLAQGLRYDIQESIYTDNYGSMNFDVDGDGNDDIGFSHGPPQGVEVLVAPDVQLLNFRVGGANDLGGIAGRFNEGFSFGAGSESSRYVWAAVNLFLPYNLPLEEWYLGWGGHAPLFDDPLPFTVNLFGSHFPSSAVYELWKGRSGYLGFRKQEDDGWHYGWFYIEKDPLTVSNGGYVTAFAWETEAGVPILANFVPEPSSMMMLLGGLVLTLRRRRRPRPRQCSTA